MWESRRFTTLRASTTCYRDSFFFLFLQLFVTYFVQVSIILVEKTHFYECTEIDTFPKNLLFTASFVELSDLVLLLRYAVASGDKPPDRRQINTTDIAPALVFRCT
jgi:hypothetical protein